MFVWINLTDIDQISDRNSPVNIPLLMVADCRYVGTFVTEKLDRFDEVYMVYEIEEDVRAKAIPDAYELIGKRKMGRKVRTRLTVGEPGSSWKSVDNIPHARGGEPQAVTLIVDGTNLAHRVRHTHRSLSAGGIDTSVTFGFLQVLASVMRNYELHSVIVCWDGGAPVYRREMCPTYKQRDHSEDDTYPVFLEQVIELQDVLPFFGISSVRRVGCEADDLMYQAAVLLGGRKVLLTTDQDLYQAVLALPETVVLSSTKGIEIGRDNFQEMAEGVPADWESWMTYRAMVGDGSDGIPGANGIGPKRALDLIRQFGSSPSYLINVANGKGLDEHKMALGVSTNLGMFGLVGFRTAYRVSRLDWDCCGARKALLDAWADWEPYDHQEVRLFLTDYYMISLQESAFYNLFRQLRSPQRLLKSEIGKLIRVPLVAPSREPLDASGEVLESGLKEGS